MRPVHALLSLASAVGLFAAALHAGDPPGTPVVTLPASANLRDLGDVDGDGFLDLVATSNGNLVVHRGDGLGGFAAAQQAAYPLVSSDDLHLADFNGDGMDDVAVIGSSVFVLLASGGGTFGPMQVVPGTMNTSAAAIGDINGDGLDDMVTITGSGAFVRVHRSLGAVGFAPAFQVPTDGVIRKPVVGDVDGNGRGDLVLYQQSCAPLNCRPLIVLLSLSGGGFSSSLDIWAVAPTDSDSLMTHDMDGDGLDDALWRDASGWVMSLSLGAGLFSPPTLVAEPQYSFDERMLTDENRDGLADVLVRGGTIITPAWDLLIQTASHEFEAASHVGIFNGTLLLAGDVNLDGAPDRVASWRPFGDPTQVLALPGDGHGQLRSVWTGTGVFDPHVGDIDLDGYPDLLVMGDVRLARGRSGGRIGELEDVGIVASWLRVADMDADGLLDLVTSSRPGSSLPAASLQVQLATAPAVFAADLTPLALTATEQQVGLDLGDLDGDGDLDALRVSDDFGQAAQILYSVHNDGTGELSNAFTIATPNGLKVNTVRLHDLDLDGDLDVLIAGSAAVGMRTALNLGTGQFSAPISAVPSAEPGVLLDSVVFDSDGDGLADLHAGGIGLLNGAWGLARFAGQGNGVFGAMEINVQPENDLVGMGLVVGDLDGDGNSDVVSQGEGLYYWFGDGSGSFSVQVVLQGPGETNVGFRGALGDVDGDGALDFVHSGALGLVLYGNGPWTELGQSLAGGQGFSRLSGAGPLTPGSTVELLVEYARPNTPGFAVLGLSDLSAPFKGGTLVPFPDVILPITSDATGEALLSAPWPGGIPPGIQFFSQAWFLTPQPAATTAVRATTP